MALAALTATSVIVIVQYPRRVMLSDVQQATKIVVDWNLPDGKAMPSDAAFELNAQDKAQFIENLSENLDLDYFRSQAVVTPSIGVYLTDEDEGFLAYYVIRRARGGSKCPSMASLRDMASRGRPLSQIEMDSLYNDSLHSKWPHLLPWPEFRYDYVLPVVVATEEGG